MAFPTWNFGPQINSQSDANRQRSVADALIAQSATPASNVGQGWGDVAAAISGTLLGNRVSDAETAGRATAADALAGLTTSSDFGSIAAALNNPWISDQQSSITSALLGQSLERSDPAYQLDLAYKQAQIDKINRGAAGDENYFGNPVAFQAADGQIQYGQIGNAGSFKPIQLPEGATFAPNTRTVDTGTELLTVGPGGEILERIAKQNLTEAQQKAVGTGLGEQTVTTIDAGRTAVGNNSKLAVLESTLANAPQGMQGGLVQAAGSIGIPMQGLDDIQAAQAIINQMVPLQRAPGSGTMSDADLALFKASLPAIINQPGGNAKIIQALRALNDYTIAHASIEEQLARGAIDQQTALQQKASIPSPLQSLGGSPAPQSLSSGASGVTIRRID